MKIVSAKNLKKVSRSLYEFTGGTFGGGDTGNTTTNGGTDTTNTLLTTITSHIFGKNATQ